MDQRWETEQRKGTVVSQFIRRTAKKRKGKADGYLLVVSEAQGRQVSVLLCKVGQPADHPCELVDAGRIEKKQHEKGKKTKAEAGMLKHSNVVRKGRREASVQSLNLSL